MSKDRRTRKQDSDSHSTDMDLNEIKDILKSMPTKTDFENFKTEVFKLTTALTDRVDKLESRIFDLEVKNDRLESEQNNIKKEMRELRSELGQKEREITRLKKEQNDHEQHGRQWNVRVFGVKEKAGETVEDCVKQCVQLFREKVGVSTVSASDVDIAHRIGRRVLDGKPRAILLRFISRRTRSLVLGARRKLKGTGLSISEDLTRDNHQLLRTATEHSATMSAWSSNGKIIVKLKNGKTVNLDVYCDVDTVLRSEMA